jgi:nicotinamide phosphoribosyltransferase
VKATHVVKSGKSLPIFKMPATDPGKKSAKGLLRVDIDPDTGRLTMYDQQSAEGEMSGLLEVVFENGVLYRTHTLAEIRARMASQLAVYNPPQSVV